MGHRENNFPQPNALNDSSILKSQSPPSSTGASFRFLHYVILRWERAGKHLKTFEDNSPPICNSSM
jgi:hypothetical protein